MKMQVATQVEKKRKAQFGLDKMIKMEEKKA